MLNGDYIFNIKRSLIVDIWLFALFVLIEPQIGLFNSQSDLKASDLWRKNAIIGYEKL